MDPLEDQLSLITLSSTSDPLYPNALPPSTFYPSPYHPNQHSITNLPLSNSVSSSLGPRNVLLPYFRDHDIESTPQRFELQCNPPYYNSNNNNNNNSITNNGRHDNNHDQADNIQVRQNYPSTDFINYLVAQVNSKLGNITPVKVNLRGRVVRCVTDKILSECLLNEFQEGRMQRLHQTVVAEINDNIVQVLRNKHGSQFFQKLLNFLDDHYLHQLFMAIMKDVSIICLHYQSMRAAQKILEYVDKHDLRVKSNIMKAIKDVFRYGNGSQNAYHFIEVVFNVFLEVQVVVQTLFSEVADHCVDMAMDQFGCYKMQHMIRHGGQGPERTRLINVIICHAFELSKHRYGNYVVSFIATRAMEPQLNIELVMRLLGCFVHLSKDKFGSHVVEKIIIGATVDEYAELIIREIISHPAVFVDLCQNKYGNFVVQTALRKAWEMRDRRSTIYSDMEDQIQAEEPQLQRIRYGMMVLRRLCALNMSI